MAILIENGSDLFEIRNGPSQLFFISYVKKDCSLFATTVVLKSKIRNIHSELLIEKRY